MDVEVTLACPDTGIDVVVVPEEGNEAAPAAAAAATAQQDASPSSSNPPSPPPSPAAPPLCLRRVKYLPPLRLDLHLGPSYPLHAPPTFTIWAPWLDPSMAAWAAGEMARMWTEVYVGGPVVFSWVEWLGRELLEGLVALSFVEGEEDGEGDEDGSSPTCPRLVLRAAAPPRPTIGGAAAEEGEEDEEEEGEDDGDDGGGWAPRLLLRLLAYTYARESEAFARGVHTCYICFEAKGGKEFATLRCGHPWCRGCLGEMARTHVRDGDLGMLVCPHPECGLELPPEVMKELLPPEGFERWERLLLNKVRCVWVVVVMRTCVNIHASTIHLSHVRASE